ncbi:CobW family GTP-binding protein [Acetobacterium wieringae]|uniref:CobW family GTP-binding protein n=1 Tax=Acetobacterium wieringae TaxID=52694 RepID=UPI002033544B|nr:GTP-binding protein [Acetobacterium wieringae]URN83187.1 GTP-binding protein [Acetobacterium wieringae]
MTIQIDIFSGFFGAGKTTLIKKLIDENVYSKKITLIENEFGEIPIDGAFLKKYNIEIKEIKAGCICCSTVIDFTNTLREIIKSKETERIIIEPSGVGKLSEIVKIVKILEEDNDIHLNLVIAAVDVTMYEEFTELFSEFYGDQIIHASTILLSRTQNVDDEGLGKVVSKIREINDTASIVTTPWDDLSGIELIGLSEADGQQISRDEDLSAFDLEFDDDDHDHDDDDHNHDIFTSWGIETPKIFPVTQLESIFESLKDEAIFGKVVRSKGKVQIDGVNWVEFDFVPNALEIRASEPDEIGRITVIGHDLNQAILDTVF